jgi:hypothetical protein
MRTRYRATTVASASEMLELRGVDLGTKVAATDFGAAVNTTPDLQYALWYAYTYICAAGGQDAAVLVLDVPDFALAEIRDLDLNRVDWDAVVCAWRRSSLLRLKRDNPELHARYKSADVVSGAITENLTEIECGKPPIAGRWVQRAFRTDKGIAALLSCNCRMLIRFAQPQWG